MHLRYDVATLRHCRCSYKPQVLEISLQAVIQSLGTWTGKLISYMQNVAIVTNIVGSGSEILNIILSTFGTGNYSCSSMLREQIK